MKKDACKMVILALFFVAFTIAITADEKETTEHNLTIAAVLEEIRTIQDVKSNADINSEKVSDELLEKLGEAVMNVQHPDPKEHEFMDRMMGGENSESLKAMHKWMGYNYIRNGFRFDDYYRGYGMMGSGMMYAPGSTAPGWYPGHMSWGISWGFWIAIILLVGALATTVVLLVKKRKTNTGPGMHPLDVLKQRLARGEINKEEFDRIKQDIL